MSKSQLRMPLKPLKMWIDGKCFSIERYKNILKTISERGDQEFAGDALKFALNKTSDGHFETKFRMPSIYYINLYKFSDLNIHQLASETNTEISIPKNGNDGYITINGSCTTDIIKSREIIHSALIEIREQLKALQFISIPVNNEEVQKNFEFFKQRILEDEPIKGLDASIFQSSLKLHLTITIFALCDETEKSEAIAVLNDCKTELISPLISNFKNMKMRVSGIDCMNDNYKQTHVLYANAKFVDESEENTLQTLANSISNFFSDRGLVKQYKEDVKLHVTLLNTRYRKASTESPRRSNSRWSFKKVPFDATRIMEKHKDYYFGECLFDTLHISQMSSIGDDGYYKPLSTLHF